MNQMESKVELCLILINLFHMSRECLDQLRQVFQKLMPCSEHSHVSFTGTSNGNFTISMSIAISKIKAKCTYYINTLHNEAIKMFTANNSNCRLMEWAVSFRIPTYSRLDKNFSCPT
jgi:hypothetical protein